MIFLKKKRSKVRIFQVLGNGNQQKPYSYSTEIIDSMLFVKNLNKKKIIVNLGFGDKGIKVKKIVDNTAELVELERNVRDDEIIINPDYAYPAYGVPSEETNEAIRLAARTEALITDPVYEGKSMQGLIDLAKKKFFPEGSKILYAHLGGAPALNGYSYYFKDG